MNRIDLGGRITIITGAARGIGRAIAERCSASGAKVAIWDVDGAAAAASLVVQWLTRLVVAPWLARPAARAQNFEIRHYLINTLPGCVPKSEKPTLALS